MYVGTLSQPHAENLLPTWDVMQIHAVDQHGGKTTDGKLDVRFPGFPGVLSGEKVPMQET